MAPRNAERRATPANDIGVNGRPIMSMKRAAPPSAPVISPYRV
jgi:hypothetical protein